MPHHLPHPVTAEHIGYARIRLHEIEMMRAHGGKKGRALADMRLAQKAHIAELIEAFGAEDRRLDGRPVEDGSMTETQVARDSAGNKASKT